jgi:response regulator RpfG family c-di-GMP phosphodiesterase
MTLVGTVLLVDDDPLALEGYAAILSRDPDLRVFTADSGPAALETVRIHRPDLVISDLRMPGMDGAALCRAIRSEPASAGILFVILTGDPNARDAIESAAQVDDLLLKPVTAAELLAKVGALLRLKRLHDQLRADKLEVERLHREVEQRFEQLLALLVHLVDATVPGAATRSVEITRLAARLAERFEIPTVLLRDLEIGAKLHEIGKLLMRESSDGEGPEDLLEGDRWRYAVASKELLERVVGLEGTAELIGAIFENWDGTGHPDRLRQGQIPLRSRILRLLIDYEAELAASRSPSEALEQLQMHGGTRYDPLALAYFDAIIRAASASPDWQAKRVHVAILALTEGMVLADDLFTASGVKLLAKGQTITGPTLETILRRHRSDPMVHGAWIERSSATPA